jgi:tetratricopeptide (TPR) repeat protein
VGLLLSAGARALGQDQTVASSTGQSDFDRGVAAFQAGRFEAALAAFDISYRRQPNAATLFQMAVTYLAMGQPYTALETYHSFLRSADPATNADKIAEANREITRIHASVGRFTLKLSPHQASLSIDGHPAVVRDSELWLMPGTHGISIRAPGYESYAQTIDAQKGRFSLEINLRQNSATPQEQVTVLLDEAQLLKSQGDIPSALARCREAQAVLSTPRGLAQLGLTEQVNGELANAEDHITAALKTPKDPYVRKNKTQLRAALDTLKKLTRNYAKVTLTGAPAEASVYVGERLVGTLGTTPLLRVPPGPVLLIGRLSGYADAVYEGELPRRSLHPVELRLEPLPPLPPPPAPPAPPVVAAPVVAPPAAPPPIDEPIAPPPPPPLTVNQADIEAQLREQGRPPEEDTLATGFELNVAAGYQFWLGDGPWNSSGGGALRVSLGARIPWFLSFGVSLINVSADLGTKHTSALLTFNPGFYVRGHSQKFRRQHAIDVWGGVAFVPIGLALAAFDDTSTLEERLAGVDPNKVQSVVVDRLGIGRMVSRQSINVPIELGVTWYLSRGVGIMLNAAFEFWFPKQLCYHASGDRYCVSDGLDTQHSLFVGAGVSFLP